MSHSAPAHWEPLPFRRMQVPAAPRTQEARGTPQTNEPENNNERFVREQLNSLVQKVYLPGHRGGRRHVTFSGLERTGMRPWVSARIGNVLAQQVSESVCLIEADREANLLGELVTPKSPGKAEFATSLGADLTVRVEKNLWLCPASRFLREDDWTPKADVVRNRLNRLKREFGYLIIHAPALSAGEDATLLGQLAEGLVLLLEANVTRRVVAVRALEMLEAMGIPLLGMILDQRSFPVPEQIYRRI